MYSDECFDKIDTLNCTITAMQNITCEKQLEELINLALKTCRSIYAIQKERIELSNGI